MTTSILLGCLLLVAHGYVGYPCSLWLLGLFLRRGVKKKPFYPSVTMIITVFNEERRIGEKLENCLNLAYPKDRLQILVASDGSTDATNDRVRSFGPRGIEMLALEERGGKEHAQRAAIGHARGEILVFTDAATRLEPTSLEQIVFNFSDPSIGCASGEDCVIGQDGKPSGEGLYVRYEMWLRRLESRVGSLIGLSGSFFAARREVCLDFSAEMQSDFRTVLNSLRLGLRGISDPEAIGSYCDSAQETREFDRKVRTVIRGLTVFFNHLELLNGFRYGLVSYQFFCHKLLRWMVPFLLIASLGANLLLAGRWPFLLLLVGQIGFYGLAILGWRPQRDSRNALIKIPTYFVTVNVSILVAWWKYLRGERVVMWNPTRRQAGNPGHGDAGRRE
jgi:glycosyltransferase involved in cell wall biosynthesis